MYGYSGPVKLGDWPGNTLKATVDKAYTYDADSTVEASGTELVTFSLGYGPDGMSVTSDGLVTWMPGDGQEGVHAVEIVATNGWGIDTQVFEINVEPAPNVRPSPDILDIDPGCVFVGDGDLVAR